MDYVALHSELVNDPKAIGYANLITLGNCAQLANLINAASGPGAGTLTLSSIAHDDFIAAILPLLGAFDATLATLPAAKQTYYDGIMGMLESSQAVLPAAPGTQQIFGAMVSDGLLTAAEVTTLTTRACSRAEVLWGEGASVSQSDVIAALSI